MLQEDAVLKITSTAICGSDLHLYVNAMPGAVGAPGRTRRPERPASQIW